MNSPPSAPPLRPPLVFLLPIALGLLLLGTLAARSAEPEPKPAEEKKPPEVLAEFKIEKGCRPIILPVTIKGKECQFILDTGAEICLFDTSLRPPRGLFDDERGPGVNKVIIATPAGKAECEASDPPESRLGKLDLRAAGPVCWIDFELPRRVIDRDLRGALGMSFLAKYVVQLRHDQGRCIFMRSDAKDHPEWGAALPLERQKDFGALVTAAFGVPGVGEMAMVVDSGADRICMPPAVFDKAVGKQQTAERLTVTAAGNTRDRVGRLPKLSLGAFELKGLTCAEDKGRSYPVVGMDVLSRFTVTFDFPAKKMYLAKGKEYGRIDEDEADMNMSGLHIWRVQGKAAVHSVDKDSPAEAAGIKAEDVILKVGDKSASEMDLWDLRDLLKSGDGKEIRMTIKRGDEEKAASFKLKKRI